MLKKTYLGHYFLGLSQDGSVKSSSEDCSPEDIIPFDGRFFD